MRVVLDTNIIVSQAISPHGTSAQILSRWRRGAIEVLVSPAILEEYADALSRPSVQRRSVWTDVDVVALINDLIAFATFVAPEHRVLGVAADPDDNIFLECALEGSAHYIVTGDRHLLDLRSFCDILIVSPAMFDALLE